MRRLLVLLIAPLLVGCGLNLQLLQVAPQPPDAWERILFTGKPDGLIPHVDTTVESMRIPYHLATETITVRSSGFGVVRLNTREVLFPVLADTQTLPRIIRRALGETVPDPPEDSENPVAASRLPCNTQTLPNPCWEAVTADIVDRSDTSCATPLTNGASLATMNSAVTACGSATETNNVLSLGAGTYSWTTLVISGAAKGHFSIRGAGPDATFIALSSQTAQTNYSCGVCITNGATTGGGVFANVGSIPTAPAAGDTTFLLGTQSAGAVKPSVGSLIFIRMNVNGVDLTDDTFDTSAYPFRCLHSTGDCSEGGAGPADQGACDGDAGDPCWSQFQIVLVTAITGGTCTDGSPCTVSIDPPIFMANWADQARSAYWSNAVAIAGVGIEDLTISTTSSSGTALGFNWATKSWAKNVRVVDNGANNAAKNILVERSSMIEIRDSYIFSGTDTAGDVYCISMWATAHVRIENNIFQRCRSDVVYEQSTGNVHTYNYSVKDWDSNSTGGEFGHIVQHGTGADHILLEGNVGTFADFENYFGHSLFGVQFRNRWSGVTSLTVGELGNVGNLAPVQYMGLSRYYSLVSNVLGTSGFHAHRQHVPGDGQNNNYGNSSISCLGNGSACDNDGGQAVRNDTDNLATGMRCHNWDVFTSSSDNTDGDQTGTRCDASEVPTGLNHFANPMPGAYNTMPASFIFPSKPSWFGTAAYPAIGPDISGGSETNTGGHVKKIPAQLCFEAIGGTFGGAIQTDFNWDTCAP